MLPNLFIPGAPKCGTSALAGYLGSHPKVFVGHIKEPNFWSADMPFFARREGLRHEEDYLDIYRRAPECAEHAIDASTHYLYSDVAIKAISQRFPDARFIVCLRPQAEIAHAWHMQMINSGYEDVQDFSQAWKLIEVRRRGEALAKSCPEPKLLDYESIACIGSQLENIYRFVDTDRVHCIYLPDLKADPRACYLGMLRFLRLGDDGRTEFPRSNVAYRNRSGFASRLVRNPALRPMFNHSLAALTPSATRRIKNAVKRVLYTPSNRAPVPRELLERMSEAFVADNRRLRALTGRDFEAG